MSQQQWRQRLRDRSDVPDGGGIDASFVPMQRVTVDQQQKMATRKQKKQTPVEEVEYQQEQITSEEAGDLAAVTTDTSPTDAVPEEETEAVTEEETEFLGGATPEGNSAEPDSYFQEPTEGS